VRATLGDQLVGVYLTGSLAAGDFDRHSDVDFVAVTENEVGGELFSALDTLHQRIATIDSWCAVQLDGAYISGVALRRFDPTIAVHANIDRGRGERLKMVQFDEVAVQSYLLRERGITLVGPDPRTLIDPVTPEDLRNAMPRVLAGWGSQILDDPARIDSQGYQSYTVLSLCRILYTLEFGAVVSKPIAAEWARETLGHSWAALIDRAWSGRQYPERAASSEDVSGTLALIRESLRRARSG
jgi:aminoglycoside adenylyltransferase-like protein/nucleotidyltransferase-like protein